VILALAKPEQMERKNEGQADQVRPRTIKEARALLPPGSQLPGQKMKQNGGVKIREIMRWMSRLRSLGL